jgi:hypothetical protein
MILKSEKKLRISGDLLKRFGTPISLMLRIKILRRKSIIFLNNNCEILIKKWMMNYSR